MLQPPNASCFFYSRVPPSLYVPTLPVFVGSVYTVLDPAPGSDGKECIVLTTTQNLSGTAKDMIDQPAFMGLSLALSVLQHLKDHVGWMSKRVIVLVADDEVQGAERLDLGIKAFIDDYHADTLDLLDR